MTHHSSARAGERFQEMLAAIAHLPDAAGAPPDMGLRVDQDRWMGRVAIGNPFRRETIDKAFRRRREGQRLALPKGDEPGAAGGLQYPASGRPVRPQVA